MAVTMSLYNHLPKLVGNGEINKPALKVMNLNNSATFTATHTKISQVTNGSSSVVTLTSGTPGTIGWTAHGFSAGQALFVTTTGALLTGLTAGSIVYVIAAGLTANAFQVSNTAGGAAIAFSGTQSGVHTAYAIGAYETAGNGWPKGGVLLPNVAVTQVAITDATVNDAMFDADDMSIDAAGGFISAFKQAVYDSLTGNVLEWLDLGEEVKAGDTTPFKIRLAILGFLNLTQTP